VPRNHRRSRIWSADARAALIIGSLSIALAQGLPSVVHSQQPRASTQPIHVRWLGHAAFEVISSGGTRLLIDPWLAQNPATPDSLKQTSRWTGEATKPVAILISHSHFDHSADAKPIAEASGAKVIGTFDHVSSLGLPEAQVMGGNVGGSFRVGDVTVRRYPWEKVYTADTYVDLLGTHSDHRMLPDDARRRLHDGVAAVIEDFGGEITIGYTTEVLIAPRAPRIISAVCSHGWQPASMHRHGGPRCR
jgi:L-ascorbate metabolism protein UlaG (beta-lactamase superfamily)